jgi:hypothetical protein
LKTGANAARAVRCHTHSYPDARPSALEHVRAAIDAN